MLTGLLVFVFLYGLIAIFERNRDDLDAFSIATAVIGPTLAIVVMRIIGSVLGLGPWAGLLEVLTLIIVTYLVLTKHLDFSAKRAIWYTVAVFFFNIAMGVGYVILTGAV